MAHRANGEVRNGVVQPLLTDFYQITMAYAYWKNKKMNDHAVFDLFFRKNPFRGEYAIFAGLDQCIKYLEEFRFNDSDIVFLKETLPPTTDPEFFEYLQSLTAKDVTLYAIEEGTVVFPKVPLIRVEGPLAVVQLLETTLLNLVNFASLVATNAARFRRAAGKDKMLLEFGLRRAQGPDGALSASKYCYIGGFDGTSNVLAAKEFGIPAKGTHAHAFVSSFLSKDEDPDAILLDLNDDTNKIFFPIVLRELEKISKILSIRQDQTNNGELKAFSSYAVAFPTQFLALVDTYDALKSGVPNFLAVASALHLFGYKALGIRLDSGDLAYLSKEARKRFQTVSKSLELDWFSSFIITASNDINEETLTSLEQQGHEINAYGIGTHLVTCQRQPALGCVFKLVELNGNPRMKLSEEMSKVTMPGKKNAYRLYGGDNLALLDLLTRSDEPAPQPNERVLCRHPLEEAKRAYVKPSTVENLLKLYWKDGKVHTPINSLQKSRAIAAESLTKLRTDHLRYLNPTPYKVSVTNDLYQFMHELWLDCAPISELS